MFFEDSNWRLLKLSQWMQLYKIEVYRAQKRAIYSEMVWEWNGCGNHIIHEYSSSYGAKPWTYYLYI